MKIDGRLIASQIRANLKEKISLLRQKNIIPHLAVILIGNDPSSATYVRQKLKVGEEIGARVSIFKEQKTYKKQQLIKLIGKLNHDNLVHGIIIQRPVSTDISKEELDLSVIPSKDVDGFYPESPFTPPIASAVIKILKYVQKELYDKPNLPFSNWLKKQKILVIGRGETAGKPIAETLNKFSNQITIAHSQTKDLKGACLASSVIITCVGRPHIVRHDMVSPHTLLIGVGLHPEDDKLGTDYNQEEIADKVAYYTPVPGGVGPVNVACLFENLLKAASC